MQRAPLALLFLLLPLAGCRGGYLDRQKTCEHDVYDWTGGLSYYLNSDRDPAFDISPSEDYIGQITGSYDPSANSGEFGWKTTYADGYYLLTDHVEGFGTVYFGGDLDILYSKTTVDTLDNDWTVMIREKRAGCRGERELAYPGSENSRFTSYEYVSSDRMVYDASYEAQGFSIQVDGTFESNLNNRYTEYYTAGDTERISEVVALPAGTQREDWEQVSADYQWSGTEERRFNGGWVSDYEVGERGGDFYARVIIDFNYDGSGLGTVEYYGDDYCVIEIKRSGQCTLDCESGYQGSC